ncbi:hypothetical protein PINS_up001284 [Pythium insidiosum]|nr:hypothetical protein PINS_up001284 [Pythium insidiosum]
MTSMLTSAPLPTCAEYDPLDDHFDELEGVNLLQDAVLRPVPDGLTDLTPLSSTNGYTSEESDYAAATPSDEKMYSHMTFLRQDSNELFEEVADFVEDNDLTALSPQQQQVFAGKMIKGKTSKYRGVTQTSKTSWGAKYSAKRITNTCKTPDEAARAYDEYLKTNHPEKYAKFANFCTRCDRFVNPLGLSEFKNECICESLSDHGSTEAESPPHASETDDDIDLHDSAEKMEIRDGSNLSISSLKLSFLEDGPIFDDSLLPGDLTIESMSATTQDPSVKHTQTIVKSDSFTLATMESFSNESNLDRIITDINRSSLPKRPSMMSTGSGAPDMTVEEWQNLTELVSEQDPPANQHASGMEFMVTAAQTMSTQFHTETHAARGQYKKIHSLDFENGESVPSPHPDVKQEFISVMDVDDIASAFMPPPNADIAMTATLPIQTHSSLAFPARVDIATPFLEKYWRNDRKNIQCFPFCPEHGDYYRVRIENLQHRCKGVCRAAVKASVFVPTNQPIASTGLLLLARCNSTFSRNISLSTQQYLDQVEIKNLQAVSALGSVDTFAVLPDGSGVQFEVTFFPDVWKFEFDLPKKRRLTGSTGADADADSASAEFLYFFEMDIFYTTDKATYQRLGHAESMSFQIGNTRTLLRQRNRMAEDSVDRVLGSEAMPEKKKVKMYMGQRGARDSSIMEGDEELEDSVPSSYITGEGIPAKIKVIDPSKPVDVDALCRIDSKDSAFGTQDYSGDKQWDSHPAVTPAYNQYVSPKHSTAAAAAVATGGVGALAAVKASSTKANRAAAVDVSGGDEGSSAHHSWAALFWYSIVCIPWGIITIPVSLLSLLFFIILPPLSSTMVRLLDTLSDMELRRANSSCIAREQRFVLNRLESGSKGCQYHASGAVWSRFIYFAGVKLIISVVVFIPALLLSIFSLLVFPVKGLSASLRRSAVSIVLVSRDFTRKSVGKLFVDGPSGGQESGDALV